MDFFEGDIVVAESKAAAKALTNALVDHVSTRANPWLFIGHETAFHQRWKVAGAGVAYKRRWLPLAHGQRQCEEDEDVDELVELGWPYSIMPSSTAGELIGMAHALDEVCKLLRLNQNKFQPGCTLSIRLLCDCRAALGHVQSEKPPTKGKTLRNVPLALIAHIKTQSRLVKVMSQEIGINTDLQAYYCPRSEALLIARADEAGNEVKHTRRGFCNTTGNKFQTLPTNTLMATLGAEIGGAIVETTSCEQPIQRPTGPQLKKKEWRYQHRVRNLNRNSHPTDITAGVSTRDAKALECLVPNASLKRKASPQPSPSHRPEKRPRTMDKMEDRETLNFYA